MPHPKPLQPNGHTHAAPGSPSGSGPRREESRRRQRVSCVVEVGCVFPRPLQKMKNPTAWALFFCASSFSAAVCESVFFFTATRSRLTAALPFPSCLHFFSFLFLSLFPPPSLSFALVPFNTSRASCWNALRYTARVRLRCPPGPAAAWLFPGCFCRPCNRPLLPPLPPVVLCCPWLGKGGKWQGRRLAPPYRVFVRLGNLLCSLSPHNNTRVVDELWRKR
jgi:hypothetical protein